MSIAIMYVKEGGEARSLGITPESIKAEFENGNVTQDEAAQLLIKLFPNEFTE